MALGKKTTKKTGPSVAEVRENIEREVARARKMVEREAAKIKKSVDASVKQVDGYVRKNPEKAAAIAAGVAAALGAAAALIASRGKKGKK